jgi:hypothetical protein
MNVRNEQHNEGRKRIWWKEYWGAAMLAVRFRMELDGLQTRLIEYRLKNEDIIQCSFAENTNDATE